MNATYEQCTLGLRVLVVEDYVDAADSLAAFIRLRGHDVEIARDGLEAINACKEHWPDVVLLDLVLPRCDGYEVARSIREHPFGRQKPLLVVISGHARLTDRLRSHQEGIHLHLAKPVDPEFLEALLQKFALSRSG
jgi:CheY-like chemotaxis protein